MLTALVTQMDAFQRPLGITQLNLREFAWAIVSGFVLLAHCEIGKLAIRRPVRRPVGRD